ncbi:MAG: hypothetical protein CVU39_18860 [Chloroflexi bacterium HGW-Chloroflexi-10]|nr:MAG: hypothetical protein CVU39_18860 [Chloroflexi bacterium HGW-Chloroflexi-10]
MVSTFRKAILSVLLFLACLLSANFLTHNHLFVRYLLAAAPIITVLILMTVFQINGHIAGPIGLLSGIFVAWVAFGLTLDVFWVSQLKGVLLSVFVLAVLWPALLLYNVINEANGIQAISQTLKSLITDQSTLLIVVSWCFSGMMEGLAGFGLPIAIIAPMLVGLGLSPIIAVASVAIGHAWSVTFGDMGVVFQTLTALVQVDPNALAIDASLMLGFACLACGLAVAHLLKKLKRWPIVVVLALLMSLTQYIFATNGLSTLAAFSAGLTGVIGAIILNRLFLHPKHEAYPKPKMSPELFSALLSYGTLTLLMAFIALIPSLNTLLSQVVWKFSFPEVKTLIGFITTAGNGQVFRPLIHPGSSILLIVFLTYLWNFKTKLYSSNKLRNIGSTTYRSAMPATIGIFAMVGLSTLMDHAGMNILLAEALSKLFYNSFPLISPFIGMLGAFATGSNNNSNVLFASLQENIATLLQLTPGIILAAQTTGGSLGSMVAPAKIFVGCSTVGMQNSDGIILKKTLSYGAVIGAIMGIITFIWSLFY